MSRRILAKSAVASQVPTSEFISQRVGSTRLKKAGGSLVAVVPAMARDLLHLTEGQELAVKVEGTKITLEPVVRHASLKVRRPRYTLDDLLGQAEAEAVQSEGVADWQKATAVGREVW